MCSESKESEKRKMAMLFGITFPYTFLYIYILEENFGKIKAAI